MPSRRESKTVFKITFEVQAQTIPETVRLRRLLKAALRSFGFRCLHLETISPAVSAGMTQEKGTK